MFLTHCTSTHRSGRSSSRCLAAGNVGAQGAGDFHEVSDRCGGFAVPMPHDRNQPCRQARSDLELDDVVACRIDGQSRHQGHSHSGGDEAHHCLVVVAAETDSRRDPMGLEKLLRVRLRVTKGDQGQLCELAWLQRPPACGEPRFRRKKNDVGIAEQLRRRERSLPQRQHREGEVELGGFDLIEQLAVRRILDQLDLHVRPPLGEPLQKRWEHAGANARKDTESERPSSPALELVELGTRRLRAGEDRGRMHKHQPAGVGQGGLADSPAPLDQPHLEKPLERGELLAHRRLAVAKPSRSSGQRSLLGHGSQGEQVPQLNASPSKRVAYIRQRKQKFALETPPRLSLVPPMLWRLLKRRTASSVARAPEMTATITLRLAGAEDTVALERLAALYDRPLLSGPVLLALVDGELQAALTLAGDSELMEPYLPTAALVDLLALRAKQLHEQSGAPLTYRQRREGIQNAGSMTTARAAAVRSPRA
jgi:hypothetical protein